MALWIMLSVGWSTTLLYIYEMILLIQDPKALDIQHNLQSPGLLTVHTARLSVLY